MKRSICVGLCLIFLLLLAGCSHANAEPPLRSGFYYEVGDYEKVLTPYVTVDTETKAFSYSQGMVLSFEERGTYEIKDGILSAMTQDTSYRFTIVDEKTLKRLDDGAEFMYNENFIIDGEPWNGGTVE